MKHQKHSCPLKEARGGMLKEILEPTGKVNRFNDLELEEKVG